MATQLQIRRGTSAQVAAFTGAEGEIVVNTTNDSVVVNDGSTAGGFEMARVDGSNWAITNAISTTANISFGDNDKAIFGAGSDLQIYHDGSNSLIKDVGAGDLNISAGNDLRLQDSSGNNYFKAGEGGSSKIYYAGAEKLATAATGIDVTGTATADKLIVNSGATDEVARFEGTGSPYISWYDTGVRQAYIGSFGNNFSIVADTPDTTVSISTGGTPRLTVNSTGVGIGTSSPASNLEISDSTQSTGATFSITNSHDGLWTSGDKIGSIDFRIDDGSATQKVRAKVHAEGRTTGTYPADSDLVFSTADNNTLSEAMRIDSAGLVGIGISSLSSKLAIHGSAGDAYFKQTNSANSQTLEIGNAFSLYSGASGSVSAIASDSVLAFATADTERLRVTSGGSVLVGKTSSGTTVDGVELIPQGAIYAVRTSNVTGVFNRQSTDGDIVQFRKNNSTVGSIGTISADLNIGTSDTGFRFLDSSDAIIPWNISTNAGRDNAIDLGNSSNRFDDIYATNGTIQTSDRNEKQDIEALTDAEQRVAVAAKGLLRKFRWISSVEENGDDARIHFGIIAQDLQDAFTAEGLDAGRYAMFINSTWTDEDGNEQTRLGVRYSELLAFIISAI